MESSVTQHPSVNRTALVSRDTHLTVLPVVVLDVEMVLLMIRKNVTEEMDALQSVLATVTHDMSLIIPQHETV